MTPDEEATDVGPFYHWPTGKGFDHFFGFLGSQTDQYKPDLVEDQAHVRPDDRHLKDQIPDKAIACIDRQKKAAPDWPFFLYFAPGATHAPHQIHLAKKYPEKLAQLKAEFEEHAKSHKLYPYIAWDDVLQGKIHRTKGSKSLADYVRDVTKGSDSQLT